MQGETVRETLVAGIAIANSRIRQALPTSDGAVEVEIQGREPPWPPPDTVFPCSASDRRFSPSPTSVKPTRI